MSATSAIPKTTQRSIIENSKTLVATDTISPKLQWLNIKLDRLKKFIHQSLMLLQIPQSKQFFKVKIEVLDEQWLSINKAYEEWLMDGINATDYNDDIEVLDIEVQELEVKFYEQQDTKETRMEPIALKPIAIPTSNGKYNPCVVPLHMLLSVI